MKKFSKRVLAILLVSGGIILALALFASDDKTLQQVGAALLMTAVLVVVLVFAASDRSNSTYRPVDWSRDTSRDTGMISCRKCGYLGVGHGVCPRCGWNMTDKITSQSTMMSCMKCGYLGAKTGGVCPRCGWNLTREIKW